MSKNQNKEGVLKVTTTEYEFMVQAINDSENEIQRLDEENRKLRLKVEFLERQLKNKK